MSDTDLTQAEADELIAMPKVRVNDTSWDYPDPGNSISVPLISVNRQESFFLDVSRGRADLLKVKHQNRGRTVIVLVRLELGNVRHRNPDGELLDGPHLHLYREGYGDKWAIPVPTDAFTNTSDASVTLHDFMRFCGIIEEPRIQMGLFS